MIVGSSSRRASQQGRSVGPPRPAVGGSVGSGAGRSVGSARAGEASRRPRAVEQPAECSGRSVVPSGLGYRAVGAPGDVASSKPCGTAVRSHGSDRTARGHTQRNFMGCSVTSSPTRSRRLRAAGRSVGVTRRHLRGPSHLRPGVGRSARPGSEPGARGRAGRSVGDEDPTINFAPPWRTDLCCVASLADDLLSGLVGDPREVGCYCFFRVGTLMIRIGPDPNRLESPNPKDFWDPKSLDGPDPSRLGSPNPND